MKQYKCEYCKVVITEKGAYHTHVGVLCPRCKKELKEVKDG